MRDYLYKTEIHGKEVWGWRGVEDLNLTRENAALLQGILDS